MEAAEAPKNEKAREEANTELRPGCTVQMHGLKGAAHLNGSEGVILREDPTGSGRWEVQVTEKDGSTSVKALKPENLAFVAGPEEEEQGAEETLELAAGCFV